MRTSRTIRSHAATLALLAGAAGVVLWTGMTLVTERSYHFHPFFIGALVPWVFSRRQPGRSTGGLRAVGLTVTLLVLGAALLHDAFLTDRAGRPGDSPQFVLSMFAAGFTWAWLWAAQASASESRGRAARALASGAGLLVFLPAGLLVGWLLSPLGL